MNEKQIVNIAIDHIFPHPDNPRKNLGDLTEIAESIKKRGIMQNLTVVPIEGKPGDYMALIGHRRWCRRETCRHQRGTVHNQRRFEQK